MTSDEPPDGTDDVSDRSEAGEGSTDFRADRRTFLTAVAVGLSGSVADPRVRDGTSGVATGDVYRAVRDGNWQDPAVWRADSPPEPESSVIVDPGVTVTLAHECTARLASVRVDGSLQFDTTVDTRLDVDTLLSAPGGSIEIGTERQPVESDVTARVTFADLGGTDEDPDPGRLGRGLVSSGALTVHGAEKTAWSALDEHPRAGTRTLRLPEPPTNWNLGDRIVVPGLDPSTDRDEERRIVAAVGSRVHLDRALQYDHVPPADGLDTYVLNLSRNVVFASESQAVPRRGHVMILSPGTDVMYARFEDLGRTNKSRPITNPVRGSVPDDAEPNPSARYPLHYHLTGIGERPHRTEGVVVEGSPGWGVVNHHAHAEVTDSMTYDVRGAGFVAEGGNERGSFERCFALNSEGSGEPIDSRSAGAHGGNPPIDDFGHAGHGFWLQSPLVEVVDNVAAGHRHHAFVWWLRPLLDNELAEGDTIDDSRVTYHPNLPLEYVDTDAIGPLLEAIDRERFAISAENDRVMQETGKIPSTFAPVERISGNTAFASAGGADFSRHNFKWKHERFSDFNVVDDMTVYSVGPFVDAHGEEHSPDLPRHQSSGHQGRGGNVGVSFRYTSNVTLRDSRIIASGNEDSVGVPFHDYLWTNVVEGCEIANWEWGVGTGEHRLTWIRNSTFDRNTVDVNWGFDNVGPAIVDGSDVTSVRYEFDYNNRKATEVLQTSPTRGPRLEGRTLYAPESAPGFVPFEESTDGVNRVEDLPTVDNADDLVGLSNAEMYDEYGVCIGGTLLPDDVEPFGYGPPADPPTRDPPTYAHRDPIADGTTGGFESVTDSDVAGGECLEWTGDDSTPARVEVRLADGTYQVYLRARPASWIGDDIHVRFDGGDWHTAEKLKSPVGFAWHPVAPNNEPPETFDLGGTHSLEVRAGSSGVRLDEIFVGRDRDVVGAYGRSRSD